MNKYLIYLRVSTDIQDINSQQEIALRHIDGLERGKSYKTEIFTDENVSATRIPWKKRKGLVKMLQTMESGDTILVFQCDRLWRKPIEHCEIYEQIKKAKVKIHSIESGDENDEFKMELMVVIAKKEVANTSLRVKERLKNTRLKGHRYGNNIPYGWQLDKSVQIPKIQNGEQIWKFGKLMPEPRETEIVEKIMYWASIDLSAREIAQKLNELGFRNRAGNKFAGMTVHRIVHRAKDREKEKFPECQQLSVAC